MSVSFAGVSGTGSVGSGSGPGSCVTVGSGSEVWVFVCWVLSGGVSSVGGCVLFEVTGVSVVSGVFVGDGFSEVSVVWVSLPVWVEAGVSDWVVSSRGVSAFGVSACDFSVSVCSVCSVCWEVS